MRLFLSFLLLLTFKVVACNEANTIKPVYAEVAANGALPYITIHAPSEYDKFIISEISVIIENELYISSSLQHSDNDYHHTTIQLNKNLINQAYIVVAYQLKNSNHLSSCGPKKTYELSKIIT